MKLGVFYGIGVGPGDPELITVKGAAILGRCRHVFVPKARMASESLALNIARRYVAADAVVRELTFPMTRNQAALARSWEAAATEARQAIQTGADACFLTLGDPLLYSTCIYMVKALKQMEPEIETVIVPGITSFCAAAALTCFPIGEAKNPVTIVPADDLKVIRAALAREGTVVLMKIGERLNEILAVLEETGLTGEAVFVARAGLEGQCVETDLKKLRAEAVAGYLSIILVHTKGGIAR
jgi:precorrin-2/cobalt-factor-2 C20-methyltransferase